MPKFLLFMFTMTFFAGGAVRTLSGTVNFDIPVGAVSTNTGTQAKMDFRYYGTNPTFTKEDNSVLPASWVGYGWQLGNPSINVLHNNTVDINDDKWFYDDGTGAISEIIRVANADGTNEKFYIRNSPYSKVKTIFNTTVVGQIRIILGWEVTTTDGTIYQFGATGTTPVANDACRKLPCFGNIIGKGWRNGNPDWCYYRWDLKKVSDINGGSLTYTYAQTNLTTTTNYSYTSESYISEIRADDNGDHIKFTLNDVNSDAKAVNEFRIATDPNTEDFDFFPTRFLRSIQRLDKNNAIISSARFVYSGDVGQVPHLNSLRQGYAKRLLTRIISTDTKALNYNFEYEYPANENSPAGLLQSVCEPTIGKITEYEYQDKIIDKNLESTVNLPFQTNNFKNSNTVTLGQHVYCWDYQIQTGETTGVKIEMFDKYTGIWQQANIAGVTGTTNYLPYTKFYPALDHFVLTTQIRTGTTITSTHVILYEFIDNRWMRSPGFGINGEKVLPLVNKVEVHDGGNFFIVFEPVRTIFYIYNKINNYWVSSFKAPHTPTSCTSTLNCGDRDITQDGGWDDEGGWNWPEPTRWLRGSVSVHKKLIFTGKNRFAYGFEYSEGSNGRDIGVHVFTWNPATANWDEGNQVDDFEPFAYCNWNGKQYVYDDLFDTGGYQTAGREYSFYVQFYDNYMVSIAYNAHRGLIIDGNEFKGKVFEDIAINLRHWVPGTGCSGTWVRQNNLVPACQTWSGRPKVSFSKDFIVFVSPENKMMIWRLLPAGWYITNVNGIPSSSLPNDPCNRKQFDLQIDSIKAFDDYFIAYNNSKHFVWCYKWDPTKGGEGEWVSILNGSTAKRNLPGGCDNQGQGYRYTNDISILLQQNQIIFNTEKLYNSWFNKENESLELPFKNGEYFQNNTEHSFTGGAWVIHSPGFGSQLLTIRNGVGRQFTGNPQIRVVNKETISGESVQKPLVTKYSYTTNPSEQIYDNLSRSCSYGKVTINGNDLALTGYTEYTYNIDPVSDLFGTTNQVVQKSSNHIQKAASIGYQHLYELQLGNGRTIRVPHIYQTENIRDGVVSKTLEPVYSFKGNISDGNGQNVLKYVFNSDGNILVNGTIFAYRFYSDIKNKNLLSLPTGNVTYKLPNQICAKWEKGTLNDIASWTTLVSYDGDAYLPLEIAKENLSSGDLLSTIVYLSNKNYPTGFFTKSHFANIGYRFNYDDTGTYSTTHPVTISIGDQPNPYILEYKLTSEIANGLSSIDLVFTDLSGNIKVQRVAITAYKQPVLTDRVVSASATTFVNDNGVMRTGKTFEWKADRSNNGLPQSGAYVPFNYATNAVNPNWILTGEITRYANNGTILESQDADRTYSSKIMSSAYNLPVASFVNARYGECLSTDFTNENIAGSNGTVELLQNSNDAHFSSRILKITTRSATEDQYALTNATPFNNSLPALRNRKFIIDFWAKADRATTSYIHLQAIPSYTWSTVANFDVTTEWKKYSVEVEFGDIELVDKQYWVVLRPPKAATGTFLDGTMYYDDLRVYPRGALAQTIYYDQKWRSPILAIDANNNPGNLIENDLFGRLSCIYKLEPSRGRNQENGKKLLEKREYFSVSEQPTVRILNHKNGSFFEAETYHYIDWLADKNYYGEILYYTIDNGLTWTNIPGINGNIVPSSSDAWGHYAWKPPKELIGKKCKLKIRFSTDKFAISDEFGIVTRPPKNTQPDSCGIFNPGSTTFSWDGPTVSNIKYDVFIDGLGYVAKDLLTRNFTYNITNVGTYTWHVEAYDGIKRQIGETWKFTVEAENFFPIYNVNGKIIRKIPTTLFNSIKSSLINNDRPDDANKLAASYNISLNNDDNKGFAFSLLYPSNMEDGRTFEYAAYRHGGWSYNRATGNIWDQEGEDCDGNTSDEYIKRIYLRKNSSNLGILPDIQFDCHYQKVGSDFTRGGNWDEEIRTTGDDNPIDQIRCAVKGCYNVWYNMRSEGQAHSVGWKSNGDWCGNDIDEYKMVLYRMFILRY